MLNGFPAATAQLNPHLRPVWEHHHCMSTSRYVIILFCFLSTLIFKLINLMNWAPLSLMCLNRQLALSGQCLTWECCMKRRNVVLMPWQRCLDPTKIVLALDINDKRNDNVSISIVLKETHDLKWFFLVFVRLCVSLQTSIASGSLTKCWSRLSIKLMTSAVHCHIGPFWLFHWITLTSSGGCTLLLFILALSSIALIILTISGFICEKRREIYGISIWRMQSASRSMKQVHHSITVA